MTASGFWPGIADGCILDRNTEKSINEAGFSRVWAKNIRFAEDSLLMAPIRPQVYGVATK